MSLFAHLRAHPRFFSIFLGVLASQGMAPIYAWPALLICLALFFILLLGVDSPKRAALYGGLFAMGYFTVGLFWVSNALGIHIQSFWWAIPFALFGLPLLLTPCWALAAYASVRFTRTDTASRLTLLITLWAAAEFGRAFFLTGFPWNLLGYTWGGVMEIAQSASILGIYGLTFLTLVWAGLLAGLALSTRHPQRLTISFCLVVSSVGIYAWGAHRLAVTPTLYTDLGVSIVQGNTPQALKWDPAQQVEDFKTNIALSRRGIAEMGDMAGITRMAVIWPETALDADLLSALPWATPFLNDMLDSGHAPVTLGTGYWRREKTNAGKNAFFNAVALVSTQKGKLAFEAIYDKHHLVPFGEYLPLEEELGLTPLVGFAGFAKGPGPLTLKTQHLPPVEPLICFEAIFANYATHPDGQWILNVSNDGWYGNTPGPYQHLFMTQMRAIEQGKPVLRAATTGISAIIDPLGRVVAHAPYGIQTVITGRLPKKLHNLTPYQNYGDKLFYGLLLLGILVSLGLKRQSM